VHEHVDLTRNHSLRHRFGTTFRKYPDAKEENSLRDRWNGWAIK